MHELLTTLSTKSLVEAALVWLAFVSLLFVGSLVVPGRRVRGPRPTSGTRPGYTLNGLALFLIVTVLAAGGQALGVFSLTSILDRFLALLIIANAFSFTVAGLLYLRHARRAGLGKGVVARTFFFGRELNPEWLGVDLKLFSYRPSLIGLALINAAFAARQFETYGELSSAMALYQIFTFVYVLNYFHFEHGMIHTWDMVAERFGWMLVWGDYVLVPFFYSMIGWFLVHERQPVALWEVAGLVALFAFGFWLFRGANEQKHRFKLDPNARIWGKPAATLDGRLLIAGFWGIGRHLNYTGEICIYLAFALTTGFTSFAPYLLPAWLTALLLHRAARDERRCRAKYGVLWDRYAEHAPFRVLPFVY